MATRSLIYAVEQGNQTWAKQAIASGANVDAKNADGISVIMLAANTGDLASVQALRKANATTSLNEKLIVSCALHETIQVKELLSQGADVNAKDAQGDPALSYAAAWDDVPTLRVLLQHGANPNIGTEQSGTAYDWAVSQGNTRAMKLLQKHMKKAPPSLGVKKGLP